MRLLILLGVMLIAASLSAGCSRTEVCKTFMDTPRVIHQFPRSVRFDEVEVGLAERNWSIHRPAFEVGARVYASLDGAQPQLVLAYYGFSVEVYALNVSSDSEQRTRAILAPAAPTLAWLNDTIGEPREVRVEGLTRQCASAWVPEGCVPGARQTDRAPWESEPSSPTPEARTCQPLMVD